MMTNSRKKIFKRLRNAGYNLRLYIEMLRLRITDKQYNYEEHGD
jgi:uncharacterized protein (UPF0335 family)